MDRRTRPPDVEEALSSMLWTPYERTPSVSSDEGEISPLRNSHPSVRTDCRRLTGEKKRYTQPIRYSFPHYGLIQPFSFNEPPSYENFVIAEKSVAAFATNSLPYLMPQFQMSPQPVMVHSFTDDFVQMQGSSTPLQQSNGVLPVRVSHPNQHQKQTETPSAVGNQTQNQNRFSTDFSLLNLSVLTGRNYSNNNNLNNNHISNINSAVGVQTTQAAKTAKAAKATTVIEERTIIDQSRCCEENGNVGDLHFSKQGTFMATTTNHSVNVDSSTTAMTMETTTNIIADLPEEFRVSKPLLNQSLYTSSSSTSPSPSPSSSSRSRVLPALVEGQPNRATTTLLNCASATNVSRIRNLDDDVSPHETVLKYSESNSCNDDGVMRLNVPAATPPTEGGRTTSVYVPSRIISNGTLLGTVIVPQPSLTIQVNQSDQQQDVVNQPSGVSIVNCYRAVPVQIVNSVSDSGKNETVVQSTTTTTITPADRGSVIDGNANNQVGVSENLVNQSENSVSNQLDILRTDLERTFISTEAQTDDLQQEQEPVEANDNTNPPTSLSPTVTQITTEALISREQRRRERRERRQARTRSQHIHPPGSVRPGFEILPDLLHSHLPPPYSTLPLGSPAPPPPLVPPIIPTIPVGPVVAEDARYVFPLPVIRRSPSERSGKGCCGQWFAGPPLRALIAVVALGGVACAVGGAALGATGLAGPPTSHLTAALLMIGVGIILVTVSGAAWRMTAPGAPPCLGLGTGADLGRCGRRPCSGRAPHGLLYPEFQHRPPPPSYQASMQEYRLRLLLLDRDRQAGVIRGASPPPTYRSNGGSLLRAPLSARCSTSSTIALPNGTSTGGGVGGGGSGTGNGAGSEYSLPPSYRSRHHNSRPPTSIDDDSPANTITSVAGITELPVCISTTDVTITPEQQQQQQQQHHQGRRSSLGMVNNLTISSSLEDVANCTTKVSQINNSAKPVDVQSIDRILKKSMESLSFGDGSGDDSSCLSRKDLVTIVTISGCTDTTEQTSGEMDILAHL